MPPRRPLRQARRTMGDQPNEFPRDETHRLLEELTKEHEGDEVTIELLDHASPRSRTAARRCDQRPATAGR
jgi:hypothetical protein